MTPDQAPSPARMALSLDGSWRFRFEGREVSFGGEEREIRSPGLWQTQFPELRGVPGVGQYRRDLVLPETWRGRAIHLVMEGVFHETTVFVDGRPVARHDDGWTTIDVDLTEALAGKRAFELGVDAVLPDERDLGRATLGETFAGKQDWYGLQGGIWKPARLEARALAHIADLSVQTLCQANRGVVRARGLLSQDGQGATLRLTLRRDGVVAASAAVSLAAAAFDCELSVDDVALWSPEAPCLYEVECALLIGVAPIDALCRTVGFRRFEARDGRLFLNDAPFRVFGALDQDWFPEQECRAPTPEFLEQRFRNAKAIGLNTLRCHVKIPDKLYFELADRLGLVVWLDMPYCEYLTPRARETVRSVFRRSVVEHANHPSICIWTLFNEGWGIDLDDNPGDRRWLAEFFDEAKAQVPGALVVDNSPCFPRNYHVKTDIEDFHWYDSFPDQTAAFQATSQAFARRAAFAWSTHGDAIKRGDEPLICSEFGVWGLPHRLDILDKDGAEPWWFESGHDWNLGAAYPHGVATRFRDAGLAAVFGDLDRFVEAAQESQFRGLKAQIEALRWEPEISGYVITELNDVQWEANGLMDARNNPRRFADRLAGLQTPWLVLARTARTAIASGERCEIQLRLVGPTAPPPEARIVWRLLGLSGEVAAGEEAATISLVAPEATNVQLVDLELDAYDGDGRSLSRNRTELCLVPRLADAVPALAPLDEDASEVLTALRWPNIAPSGEPTAVLLATRLSAPVREMLLAGREVVLIANSEHALADPARPAPRSDRHNFPRMDIRKRDGTPWDGRWMGAFAWRRIDGAWSAIPGGPLLDEHWCGLTPNFVLTGFLSTAYAGLVDAGVVVGWLHASAAYTKRTRLGPGRLTVTSFEFRAPEAASHPLAPLVLAAVVAG
jgi:Glycosyl hydrolases family 2, sugar binding domain/Glycosyl hydrolases family 2